MREQKQDDTHNKAFNNFIHFVLVCNKVIRGVLKEKQYLKFMRKHMEA